MKIGDIESNEDVNTYIKEKLTALSNGDIDTDEMVLSIKSLMDWAVENEGGEMRPKEEVHKAHDILLAILRGDVELHYDDDQMKEITNYFEALCWALNHNHGRSEDDPQTFAHAYTQIRKDLKEHGYSVHHGSTGLEVTVDIPVTKDQALAMILFSDDIAEAVREAMPGTMIKMKYTSEEVKKIILEHSNKITVAGPIAREEGYALCVQLEKPWNDNETESLKVEQVSKGDGILGTFLAAALKQTLMHVTSTKPIFFRVDESQIAKIEAEYLLTNNQSNG